MYIDVDMKCLISVQSLVRVDCVKQICSLLF